VATDWNKVDEVTMALLRLTSFSERGYTASWKTHSWDVMNRLHEKGWIQNPIGKAKSVVLTEEGARQAAALFAKHFGS
jgi:Mn-dependent DtxR family transcriptional regulator